MANWNEIKALKDQIEDQIFELNGVNYVDIETEFLDNGELGEAILLVGTKEEALIPEIEKSLQPLMGEYEVKVVQFEVSHTIDMEVEVTPESLLDQDERNLTKYRPLIGGINIGIGIAEDRSNNTAGTLGVFLPSSTNPHSYVGLSNQHVVGQGEAISQPEIISIQPPIPIPIMTSSFQGQLDPSVDANFCTFTNYDSFITREVLGIGVVRGSKSAALQMPVQKSGMMSGLTSGKIISITATIKIDFHHDGVPSTMKNQIKIESSNSKPFQISGDSGSALLSSFAGDSMNKSACLTGLMYGVNLKTGDGFACHAGILLSQLGLTVSPEIPLYQFGKGTINYYTTNFYNMNGSKKRESYEFQKIKCYVWSGANDSSDLIPLYRLSGILNDDILYTISEIERPSQYNYDGIACYIKPLNTKLPTKGRALVPIYRWYNTTTTMHILTLSDSVAPHGYKIEEPIGMVLSPTTNVGS